MPRQIQLKPNVVKLLVWVRDHRTCYGSLLPKHAMPATSIAIGGHGNRKQVMLSTWRAARRYILSGYRNPKVSDMYYVSEEGLEILKRMGV